MIFRRSQVAWTIARVLTAKPSPVFERDVILRVQRLIDSDRTSGFATSDKGQAFHKGELPGKGTTVGFTEENVFLLLLGVLLLQSGLTQSRIVRLVQDLQADLCRQYQWIISHTPETLRGARTDEAWRKDLGRGRIAVEPAHLSYVVATGDLADLHGAVIYRLCRNTDQFIKAIAELSYPPRPLIALELTNPAWAVWHWLPQAPLITRGRRPSPR
jgi:hypothetical protein